MQFWELDTDHDFIISKEDLIRYGNHSLTYRIIDRIFQQVERSLWSCELVHIICHGRDEERLTLNVEHPDYVL